MTLNQAVASSIAIIEFTHIDGTRHYGCVGRATRTQFFVVNSDLYGAESPRQFQYTDVDIYTVKSSRHDVPAQTAELVS